MKRIAALAGLCAGLWLTSVPVLGQESVALEGHGDRVNTVQFTADGRRLVSGASDGTIRVWDVGQASSERLLTATGKIVSVAVSPDGTRLAAGSTEAHVHVWNLLNGKRLKTLRGHTGWVTSLQYTANGKRLVSASQDGTVRVWNPVTGATTKKWKAHAEGVGAARLSADGRKLVTVRSSRKADAVSSKARGVIWNYPAGTRSGTIENPGRSLHGQAAISTDWIAAVTADSGIAVFKARTGNRKTTLLHGDANAVAISPDGNLIASGSKDGSIRTWNPWTEDPAGNYDEHNVTINDLAFSPDGQRLASASSDGTIRLWTVGSTTEATASSSGGAGLTTGGGGGSTSPTPASLSDDEARAIAGVFAGFALIWVVFVIVGMALAILQLVFVILYIVDAVSKRDLDSNTRILWVLILIFTGLIGCILYYFMVKTKVPLRATA